MATSRRIVTERANALAKVAEILGLKDRSETWEIRPGSPAAKSDWQLWSFREGRPVEIVFLKGGHLGWSAKEAATALEHMQRVCKSLAVEEKHGADGV